MPSLEALANDKNRLEVRRDAALAALEGRLGIAAPHIRGGRLSALPLWEAEERVGNLGALTVLAEAIVALATELDARRPAPTADGDTPVVVASTTRATAQKGSAA